MSDYHVHYHVNVITPSDFSDATSVVPGRVFPHMVTGDKSEVRIISAADGATTFAYIESMLPVDTARMIALENPSWTIVLLSHGHDEFYEERTALVLQGDSARFEVNTVSSGKPQDVIGEALRDDDFAAGQPA